MTFQLLTLFIKKQRHLGPEPKQQRKGIVNVEFIIAVAKILIEHTTNMTKTLAAQYFVALSPSSLLHLSNLKNTLCLKHLKHDPLVSEIEQYLKIKKLCSNDAMLNRHKLHRCYSERKKKHF